MIDRPTNLEDKIGGKVQIEHYTGSEFDLMDWELTAVLDDILKDCFVATTKVI